MALLQRQSQSQRLQQKPDAQLLLTNRLLQMSSLELQQCLAHELAENPALEEPEEPACRNCVVPSSDCAACPSAVARFGVSATAERVAGELPRPQADAQTNPLDLLESPLTLRDHLLDQLHIACGPADLTLGRYLIDNIDNEGYLRCSVEEAATGLGVTASEVLRVLGAIQTFDPSGVGARSLQECLLIQARALAAEGQASPLVETIIERFWKELAAAKWRAIARGLRVSVPEVERHVAWLRRNLSPYPGTGFRPNWQRNAHLAGNSIRPDVIIRRDEEGELTLEVVSEEFPELQINREYSRMWQWIRERPGDFDEAQRRHVRDYMFRAQMFMRGLQDRGSILRRLAECLLVEQENFFNTEQDEALLPLTQSQLASFLRVHESTVSRAVADKFVQLLSGRVVPLSFFFDRSLSLRTLVANMVASEDPSSPYSDQQISDLLRREGVQIARRTVMKYREEMNILSSRQRARTKG